MEFARQEYLWLLLVIPLVILLWGIGLWHQRRMRIRFGNIEENTRQDQPLVRGEFQRILGDV